MAAAMDVIEQTFSGEIGNNQDTTVVCHNSPLSSTPVAGPSR